VGEVTGLLIADDPVVVGQADASAAGAGLPGSTFRMMVYPSFEAACADRERLDPQILLVQVDPQADCPQSSITQCINLFPNAPLMVLLREGQEAFGWQALELGASDFLLPSDITPHGMARSVRHALACRRYQLKIDDQAVFFERIFDALSVGIVTLDEDRRVLLANPVARDYLHLLTRGGSQGPLDQLGPLPIQELLGKERDVTVKEIMLLGTPRRIFEVHATPSLFTCDQEGWTLLLRDITQARQVQETAEKQDRLAAVGQLASGIAHDFNNIMGAILLYSEMILAHADLDERDRERLQTIMEQTKRAAGLTRQILDFSRSGLLEPHRMDLVPFLGDMRSLLQRTLPENIRIALHAEDDVCIIDADSIRLRQVFLNIAFNARDAMPEGGTLSFSIHRHRFSEDQNPSGSEMSPGDWIAIEVEDTGEGIPASIMPHIFEPFFTTKSPGEGSGLGLPQVYGIIKQHGGHVEVKSKVGHGTKVIIYLPAHQGQAQVAVIKDPMPGALAAIGHVLVVEDDHPTRIAIGEVLRQHGFQVTLAANGEEALCAIKTGPGSVDLVLSDLVMPGMGGMKFIQRLRNELREAQIVVMTGYPLGMHMRELLQQGGIGWLVKPLRSEALLKAVGGIMPKHEIRG